MYQAAQLTRAECGAESERDAVGWRAYLGSEGEEGEQPSAYLFCPECSKREFDAPTT
jgi:hypothetical protein